MSNSASGRHCANVAVASPARTVWQNASIPSATARNSSRCSATASSWRWWAVRVAWRWSSSCRFALESGQPDHFGQAGVRQPLRLALELAQGLADGRLPGLELLGQPCPASRPGQRAGDLGGIGQQRAQVGPDQLVPLLRGDVAGAAALPLGHPQRVSAAVAQVVAVAGRGLADGARQPARTAADQRAQQVLVAGVARRGLLVGVQLGLHPGEGLPGNGRRDRHRDPVLLRPGGMALARPGREQRRLAPAGRRHPGAVGQRPAGIGRIAQDAADAGHVPARLARRGRHPQIGQPPGEPVPAASAQVARGSPPRRPS